MRTLERRRIPWLLGIVAAALVGMGAWSWLSQPDEAPPPPSATTVTPAPDLATTTPEDETDTFIYVTSGFEEIDALGGSRHDYPPETAVTLIRGGCGVIMRWTALDERWRETEVCLGGEAPTIARFDSSHRWFGRTELQRYVCEAESAFLLPPEGLTRWEVECATEDRVERFATELVGTESMVVGGEEIEVLHLLSTSELSGSSTGTTESETWWIPDIPLPAREITKRSSTTGSLIGDVHYTETYELRLASLQPRGP